VKGSKKPKSVSPAVLPRPERLPLSDPNFSWEQFEAFCRHFVSSLPEVEHVHHYGKRGNRQRGIDLVAKLRNGQEWVFQCKQHRRFTSAQASKAVSSTTYKAARYILLLACEATSEVRDEIKKHRDWSLWDVRDISINVRTLPPDVARAVVETHFGSDWRSKFLGLAALGTFVSAEEFFRPLVHRENLFNHSWILVGRDQYTAKLHDFTSSDRERVLVLIGRGGIGKTKILHGFSSDFNRLHPNESLRFTVEGIAIDDEGADKLPPGPCTIVIDDAYRREDLTALLALARRRTEATKVILAIRPYASERLRSLLTQVGYDTREVVVLDELRNLGLAEVKALAAQALGDPNSRHIHALAAATRDSPLITVIGGRLLAEQAIDVRLLERHDEFRHTVLSRFQDILIGQVADLIEPAFCRSLLRLVAAVSPFRLNNDALIQAGATHLNVSPVQLAEALGILEESGVLLRRGYTLRITPDVLADHILHNACVTSQGAPTGYAQQVFNDFASICPAQVLSNLSELDWRIRSTTAQEPNLLEIIWDSLRSEFASASNAVRCHILDILRESAHYQPSQVLEIVEYALRNPAPPDQDDSAKIYQFTHANVLRKVPELLQRIGYTLEYLPHCCDLLWELGRDDSRQTGPNPEHAVRILEDYARYDLGKPISVNEIVVCAVERWLASADVHQHVHSVFGILNGVLQKSGHSSYSEGHTIFSRGFLVNRDNTAKVRAHALRLVFNGALSPRLVVSLKAIDSLKLALQDPAAYYDMVITEEELQRWEPETTKVLDLFDKLIGKTSHPIIHLAIIDAVRWHAHLHKLPAVREKAKEVLARVPETSDLRLVRDLTNGYDYYTGLDDSNFNAAFDERLEKIHKERQRAVDDFLREYPEATSGRLHLESEIAQILEGTGKEPQPWPFLQQLASTDMKYAATMAEAIVETPESLLATQLSSLLPFVNQDNPALASSIARRVVASKDSRLAFSLAAGTGFWGARWQHGMPTGDLQIIRQLSEFEDPMVRLSVIRLLPVLWASAAKDALEIASSIKTSDQVALLSELCGILNPKVHGIPPDQLSDEQLKVLLGSIGTAASIDDWHIGNFIAYSSVRLPRLVVEMLLSRIARSDEGIGSFQPLPPLGLSQKLDGLINYPEYKDLLRMVRDRILEVNNGLEGHWYLPRLFEEVSLQFSQPGLEVLDEWIGSENAEKIIAASRLLKEAYPNFVFIQEAFVANLLEKAHAAGDQCYRAVGSYLEGSAISGERMGRPGEPFPQDIALRDQSREAASRYLPGSPVHRFYETLRKGTEASIKDQLARDEEVIQ
jgi:hypothetical protein